MDLGTFQNVVRAGTPFDTGQMSDSWVYFETPYQLIALADLSRTPYFVFNEEGTIYTTKNQWFIKNGIVGQINDITYKESVGLPYSYEETNRTISQRKNSMLQSLGIVEVVR